MHLICVAKYKNEYVTESNMLRSIEDVDKLGTVNTSYHARFSNPSEQSSSFGIDVDPDTYELLEVGMLYEISLSKVGPAEFKVPDYMRNNGELVNTAPAGLQIW